MKGQPIVPSICPTSRGPDVAIFQQHLARARYGNFQLTDAVRPALSVPIRPREGYHIEWYQTPGGAYRLPILRAAVSAERLMDLFMDLLAPLGETLNVVLESSHGRAGDSHADFRRDEIDAPVLLSHFYDFEELLINDGCTGVAVMAAGEPLEVQFDEHKQLTIYAPNLSAFEAVFASYGIERREVLSLLSEGEHLHHTTPDAAEEFEQLTFRLGITEGDSVFSEPSL